MYAIVSALLRNKNSDKGKCAIFKCLTDQKFIPCDTYHLDIVCTSLDKYTNPHVLVQTTIHQTPEAGQH